MIRKSPTETDREVLRIVDFTDADIEAVRRAGPSKDAEAFNKIECPDIS